MMDPMRCLAVILCTMVVIFLPGGHAMGADKEPGVVEKIDVEPVWAGHPVGFDFQSKGGRQYIAYYNAARQMTVAARMPDAKEWEFKRLDSKVGWDSHNYVTIAFDREGCMHVAGNMHCVPLVYFRASKPDDVQSLEPVHRMTGQDEARVTYPKFMNDAEGRLLFMYRDGQSGNGRRFINVYEEKSRSWSRLIDTPLLSGVERNMNAYPTDIVKGPDGWFHLLWMWRDTSDCASNHDISYAKSPDLKNWETAGGKSVNLPMTPDNRDVVVDPAPAGKGLINMAFAVGFDPAGRPVVAYHKYDPAGNSQVYTARWEKDGWNIRAMSDWDWRWEFSKGGSVPSEVGAGALRILPDGRLALPYHNKKKGGGVWELNPDTLAVVGKISLPPTVPRSVRPVETAFEGMQVRFLGDEAAKESGKNAVDGKRPDAYYLRWETLGPNRDRPRTGPLPEPGMLRLYRFSYPQ